MGVINYDIHNFSHDIEIFNCAFPIWRLNYGVQLLPKLVFGIFSLQYAIWSLCYDIILSQLIILLLQCPDLSLFLDVRLLYFAVLPLHSSILQFRHWVLLLWFVIFIACVSSWCFDKVTCSSAWHSETSFRQDNLFPARIIIMLIYFRSVALSWLETWRLFVTERWIY